MESTLLYAATEPVAQATLSSTHDLSETMIADAPAVPSVRFDMCLIPDSEQDTAVTGATQLDAIEAMPLSGASDADVLGNISSGEESDRPVSPEIPFEGEITVYYDTVTMNPEWDQDSVDSDSDNEDQPSAGDATDALLAELRSVLPSASTDVVTSMPASPAPDTLHFAVHDPKDSVVAELDDVDTSAETLPDAVDYDADTSSWLPVNGQRAIEPDSESGSDDQSDVSPDDDGDESSSVTLEDHDTDHSSEIETAEKDPLSAGSHDVDHILATAVSGGSKAEEDGLDCGPVSESEAQSKDDGAAGDKNTSTLEENFNATAVTSDPDGNVALITVAEDAVDDVESSSLVAEDISAAPAACPEPEKEGSDGHPTLLSRATSVHAVYLPGLMDASAVDVMERALAGDIPAQDLLEVKPATADALPTQSAAITTPPSNTATMEPKNSSEVIIETVEPMSLVSIFWLWIQSILYVKVIGIILGSIYNALDWIGSFIPAGSALFMVVAALLVSIVLAVVPFMGFTGVVSLVGILLGCFHVSSTGGKQGSAESTYSVLSGASPAKLRPGFN